MTTRGSDERPNFLIIMSDEHGAKFSGTYGHPLVNTPNMDRLAAMGVTFDNGYCNSPLCVPSRASFMTGQYVSNTKTYDNSTPMRVDAVTWPYLLRSEGYDAVLDGKMHLIGPDPLHGFDRQLAHDPHAEQVVHPQYPWIDGCPTSDEPWPSVFEAGPGTTPMVEADDEMEAAALDYLQQPGRHDQPWAICVGFIAPHFPFVVPEPYFSKYYPHNTDMPDIPEGHLDDLPAAAKRLGAMFGVNYKYTDDEVRRARAAYYGLVEWMDAKIGRLLDSLEANGLADNTVIIHTSDHGDSLGEHGLWRKMSMYEASSHIPIQIAWPGHLPAGKRVSQPMSNVDVTATIVDVAGFNPSDWDMDGDSLVPLMNGDEAGWKNFALVEHLAHGTDRALVMVRSGSWKLTYGHADPPELELYDLETDPGEFNNLVNHPAHAPKQQEMWDLLMREWGEPAEINRQVMQSQADRGVIRAADGGKIF
jgi:choline-sulfatase